MSKQDSAENSRNLSPRDALLQMTTGYWLSEAIYVAAKLGIADLLRDGPKSDDELARLTDVDLRSLYRVMRVLVSVGVFAQVDNHCFGLTPISECLQSGVPDSMRGWAIMMGEGWFCRPWLEILYSVKTGKPAADYVYGMGTFEHFARNAEAAGIFNEAMTGLSAIENAAVTAGYDFSSIGKIVDVAGGQGSLIVSILKSNPKMKGVLFDIEPVIAEAGRRIDAAGLSTRCELVVGDFFKSVPGGGDAYLLKHILHDWDDERSVAILRNCRQAMAERARLLVVETVIPPGADPFFGKLLDLNMLIRTGGCERTEAEYRSLFTCAGFKLTSVMPTQSAVSVVEGVRA